MLIKSVRCNRGIKNAAGARHKIKKSLGKEGKNHYASRITIKIANETNRGHFVEKRAHFY